MRQRKRAREREHVFVCASISIFVCELLFSQLTSVSASGATFILVSLLFFLFFLILKFVDEPEFCNARFEGCEGGRSGVQDIGSMKPKLGTPIF